MIHLFISYGSEDGDFARKLAEEISNKFKGKIRTRIIEDHKAYDGKTWKEKVLNDLNICSIFLIIFTQKSKYRQWVNQELGYAQALLDFEKTIKFIPVVEIKERKNGTPIFIHLSGFLTEDMDKIGYELDKPKECMDKIIKEIENIDLEELELKVNPHLAKYDKDELKILNFIVKSVYDSGTEFIMYDNIKAKIPDISEDIIRDAIKIFEGEGLLEYGAARFDKLTALGFHIYAQIFLGVDTERNANVIFELIASFEGKDETLDGNKIYGVTKLPPVEINYAIDILEYNNLIRVSRYMGTGKYHFGSARLTAEGRKVYRNSQK